MDNFSNKLFLGIDRLIGKTSTVNSLVDKFVERFVPQGHAVGYCSSQLGAGQIICGYHCAPGFECGNAYGNRLTLISYVNQGDACWNPLNTHYTCMEGCGC